jgi:hypothetical protein
MNFIHPSNENRMKHKISWTFFLGFLFSIKKLFTWGYGWKVGVSLALSFLPSSGERRCDAAKASPAHFKRRRVHRETRRMRVDGLVSHLFSPAAAVLLLPFHKWRILRSDILFSSGSVLVLCNCCFFVGHKNTTCISVLNLSLSVCHPMMFLLVSCYFLLRNKEISFLFSTRVSTYLMIISLFAVCSFPSSFLVTVGPEDALLDILVCVVYLVADYPLFYPGVWSCRIRLLSFFLSFFLLGARVQFACKCGLRWFVISCISPPRFCLLYLFSPWGLFTYARRRLDMRCAKITRMRRRLQKIRQDSSLEAHLKLSAHAYISPLFFFCSFHSFYHNIVSTVDTRTSIICIYICRMRKILWTN